MQPVFRMASESIDEEHLGAVTGGNAQFPPRQCTPDNPTGAPPQRYWENSPPGSHGGHGGHGGHRPHLDPPVYIRHPRPRLPPIVRSDRRLKRRIRSL
jgi:hypothetical protein